MQKLLLYLSFSLLFITNCLSQCPSGDITLKTQAEIDNFNTNYPGCTNFIGNIIIGDPGTITSSINNLNGLSTLTSVSESLYVFGNSNISNLNGLSNLETVGNELNIFFNDLLVDLTGLSSLISVNEIDIRSNNSMLNFNGLDNLITLGNLTVFVSDSLEDFQGLESITSIGFLNCAFAPKLKDFNGLNNLVTITDGVSIEQCNLLKDFTGLNSVTSISSVLRVFNNSEIINLNGLDMVSSIGAINISYNAKMKSLDGLESVNSIAGYLGILGNMPDLTDISGISNIDHTTILNLFIQDNINLSVCSEVNICSYLNDGTKPYTISGNASGCSNTTEISNSCNDLSSNDLEISEKLTIYPNPVKNLINISDIGELNPEQLLIYDINGLLIRKINKPTKTINLSKLHSGVYFLEFKSNKGQKIKKIIKL